MLFLQTVNHIYGTKSIANYWEIKPSCVKKFPQVLP